jgi:hypothetical protein
MTRAVRLSLPAILFFTVSTLHAGVLVTHTAAGYQFGEAISININGKDKAFNLGGDPTAAAATGKLASVKLGDTLIRNGDNGVVAIFEGGGPSYLLPEGIGKNEPKDPRAAWEAARISYRKSQSEKTPVEVPASSFVAFLAGGVGELTRICADDRMMRFVAPKGKAFALQLELVSAVAKTYAADPEAAGLQTFVERAMRERYQRFESGVAGLDVLGEALQLVELSQALYPKSPEQEKLRQELTARKSWLDRKQATLRAFAAAGEWDPFLLADREFERYQNAYPEMGSLHNQALKASLDFHRQNGEALLKDSEFGPAYRQFLVAALRQPSDKMLQQRVSVAWTDYSRQLALDHRGKRKQLTAGERDVLNQALRFAAGYKDENKLDEALKSAVEAQNVDPDSLPVLLKKAEILGARREFSQALATLDEYDKRAIEEERDKGSSLRADLLFKRTSSIGDIKAKLQHAWADGNYHQIRELALQGLSAKDDDSELLYQIGVAAMVTRQPDVSRRYFNRYLDLSNTLDADSAQRVKVRNLMAGLNFAARKEAGEGNWLSGDKLPAGVFYSPLSLAFQNRIDRIEATNKMHIVFDWQGDRLRTITPSWEKQEHAGTERRIFFGYDDTFPQVNAVSDRDVARLNSADPDERYKRSSLLLLNNPYVDPIAVQKLTGKNLALGIAGNRFFNPFVWDGVHYFQLTYDDFGRVTQARELAPGGGLGNDVVEFEWNGAQLQAVHGYSGIDPSRRVRTYERTLEYQDNRLVAEEIHGGNKNSKIKYVYNGGRLASAVCDKDPTLDDRARQVTFR